VTKATEEIVYEEAVRAIDEQVQQLSELRSRTSIVLVAYGLTASFLGAASLEDGSGLGAWLAILFFALGTTTCIRVLLPQWKAWGFVVSAPMLIQDFLDVPLRNDSAQLLRFLATTLDEHHEENSKRLERLYVWFWLACLGLAVQTGLWLLELALD